MGGLERLLYTARDALAASTFGLDVTGQNITNVNTPGYVRRAALLETRVFGREVVGSVGVAGLERISDAFTAQRHLQAVGLRAAASEQDRLMATVEALFADAAGAGLGDSLNRLFSSFEELAGHPTDPVTRQALLARAEVFAAQMRQKGDALANLKGEMLTQAHNVVSQINSYAERLAAVGAKIHEAKALTGQAPDLEDQRDRLLLDLGELVDIRSFTDGEGDLVVQVGGTVLVEGSMARSLGIDIDSAGAMAISLQGGSDTDITDQLSGGKLAALRDARDVDTEAIATALNDFAFDVATAINAVHSAGYGLDGGTGRNLFSVTATADGAARMLTVDATVAGNPNAVAASSDPATLPGGNAIALQLAALFESDVATGSTRTPAEAYADLIGNVGQRRQDAEQMLEVRLAVEDQAYAMRESISGVSLDEEMVALTQFQRSYQAATQVLAVVNELMDELVRTLR